MLLHDLVEVLLGNLLPHFVHSNDNVVCSDSATAVSVKLVEYCLQIWIVQELFHIHSRNQKFSVIDFVISMVIDLVNNFLNFCVWNFNMTFFDSLFEFLWGNHMSAILINLFKISPQFFNLAFICHLDQHVHGSLLEFTNTSVISEPIDSVGVELMSQVWTSSLFIEFDPWVF